MVWSHSQVISSIFNIQRPCCTLQDKEASDSFENAMTVMKINPFLKTAMRQLKGIRLEQTDDAVVLNLLSRFPWFKVAMHAPVEQATLQCSITSAIHNLIDAQIVHCSLLSAVQNRMSLYVFDAAARTIPMVWTLCAA